MTSLVRTSQLTTTPLLVTLLAVGCSFPKDQDPDTGEIGGQPTSGSTVAPPGWTGDFPTDVAATSETSESTDVAATSEISESTDVAATSGSAATEARSETTHELNPNTDESAAPAPSTSNESSSVTTSPLENGSETSSEPNTADAVSQETDGLSTTSEVVNATSEGVDATSDVETTVPWTPIDWLAPPNGLTPFALPEQYSDVEWFDVDRGVVLATHYDAMTCSKTYDAGDGQLGFVECYGSWACQCYRGLDVYKMVHLPPYFVDTSFNPGEACRLAAAFCHTDVPPTTTECYDSGQWGGISAHGCVRDDACTFRHPTEYGEISEFVLMPYVECFVTEELFLDGKSTYRCLGNDIAGFDIRGKLDGEAGRTTQNACDVGYEVFFHGIDPGSEGPLECAQVPFLSPIVEAVNGEERTCRARYTCQRRATSLAEEVFLLYPEEEVGCSNHSGTWTCPCDGGQRYTWSGVDGFTACNNALTACLSHIVE